MESRSFKQYNPQKPRRAPKILDQHWIALKEVITQWHYQCFTRAEMLTRLNVEYDFYPSMGQLVARLGQWNLKIYTRREKDDHETVSTSSYMVDDNSAVSVYTPTSQPFSNDLYGIGGFLSPPTPLPESATLHPGKDLESSSSIRMLEEDSKSDHRLYGPFSQAMVASALVTSIEIETRLFPPFSSEQSMYWLQVGALHLETSIDIEPGHLPLLIATHRNTLDIGLSISSQLPHWEVEPIVLFLQLNPDWLRSTAPGVKLRFSHRSCYVGLSEAMLLPAYIRDALVKFDYYLFGPKRRDFFEAIMTFCAVLSSLGNAEASAQLQEYLAYCCLATSAFSSFPKLLSTVSGSITSNVRSWKNKSFSANLGSPSFFERIFDVQQRAQSEEQSNHEEEEECKHNDFACRLPATLQNMLQIRVFLVYTLEDILLDTDSASKQSDNFVLQLLIAVLRYWHVGMQVILVLRRRRALCSFGYHVYEQSRLTAVLINLLISACGRTNANSDDPFQKRVAFVRDCIIDDLKNLTSTCYLDVVSLTSRGTAHHGADGPLWTTASDTDKYDTSLAQLFALCIMLKSGADYEGHNTASYIRKDLEDRLHEVDVLFVSHTFQALLFHKLKNHRSSLRSLPGFLLQWRLVEGATQLLLSGAYREALQGFVRLQQHMQEIDPSACELVTAGGSVYDMFMASVVLLIGDLQSRPHDPPSEPRSSAFTLMKEIFQASSIVGELFVTPEHSTIMPPLSHAGKLPSHAEDVKMGQKSVDIELVDRLSEVSIRTTSSHSDLPNVASSVSTSLSSGSRSFRRLAKRISVRQGSPPSVWSEHMSIDTRSSWSFGRVTGYDYSPVASMQFSD